MKITIELADPLLEEAKQIAAAENTNLQALLVEGLRKVLVEKTKTDQPFKLRDASFKGRGLRKELEGANWATIRAMAYEARIS